MLNINFYPTSLCKGGKITTFRGLAGRGRGLACEEITDAESIASQFFHKKKGGLPTSSSFLIFYADEAYLPPFNSPCQAFNSSQLPAAANAACLGQVPGS